MVAFAYVMIATAAALLIMALVVVVGLAVGKLEFARSAGRSLGIAGAWTFALGSVAAQFDWPVNRAVSQREILANARFVFNAATGSMGGIVIAALLGWVSFWIASYRIEKRRRVSKES